MTAGALVNLRARELTDAENSARWASDEELLRLMGDRYQQSLLATEAFVRSYVEKPLSFDEPRFAIETKDGHHIGGLRLFSMSAEARKARLAILIASPSISRAATGPMRCTRCSDSSSAR